MRLLPLAVLATALFSFTAHAQTVESNDGLDQHAQAWLVVTGQGHLTGDLRWFGEFQPRFDFNEGRAQQILLRGALGWQLAGPFSFWAGYGFTPGFLPGYVSEHRPFVQLLADQQLGAFKLANRTRFEERLIGSLPAASLRLRHMVRALRPIAGGLSVAAYDELFVNLNRVAGGPESGLDQNRLFVGLSYRVNDVFTAEGGYMVNYLFRSTVDRLNHNAVLALAASFPREPRKEE